MAIVKLKFHDEPIPAAVATWFAVLSWLVAERVYFPGTTFLEDAESLVRVEIGWGWLMIGVLGILMS